MKRFYKNVSIEKSAELWRVLLDGRSIKTPAKADLVAPTQMLAQALADEWAGQGETIDIQRMHLTRLANVAIDRTPTQRAGMIDELVRYCETDLVCFLAPGPAELVERQISQWRPLREWVGKTFGIVLLEIPDGLLAAPQPPASLEAARKYAEQMNDWTLTGLAFGLGLLGSAVLAIAAEQTHIETSDAFNRSVLDEDWQAERWGRDEEAEAARTVSRHEAEALGIFFKALRGEPEHSPI